MTASHPAGPSSSLVQRFDEAQRALAALLVEALAGSSPGELLEALGLEALERHLPSDVRLRLLQQALLAGRAGRPFDDAALLGALSPAMLVAHLPATTLREALVRLSRDAVDESAVVTLPPVALAALVARSTRPPRSPRPWPAAMSPSSSRSTRTTS